MRYLFFFVHPSKFHVFRRTINTLIDHGHEVDILITSKDVLEDLVKAEGWNYTNIFPEGRKMHGVPPYISSAINFFRTIYRLYIYTKYKKYDLFVTDDLLVYIGKWKRVPSIVFNDDDLLIVKQYALVLSQATHILSPDITRVGKFSHKKIGFPGYKELAYLHPNVFFPDIKIVEQFNPDFSPYFILRLVSLRAYHDVGMKGLGDQQVLQLINLLQQHGKIFISSERPLSPQFEYYRLNINPENIAHVLYHAKLFVGDSQTMTSEAAVLGTPAFRCSDFVGRISVMDEKEDKYSLSYNFPPAKFDEMLSKIEEILALPELEKVFENRKKTMLHDKIDLSAFMIWLFENYSTIDLNKAMPFYKFR
jgi:predicted glycosyltransferase